MPRSGWIHPLAAVAVVLLAGELRAAPPLSAQGTAIQTSQYNIDLFQGPVLASSRPTGLAGAYAAIAEGVDGFPVNAAAPAVRQPWSLDYIDYDLSVGATFPGSLSGTDFDNNGTVGFSTRNFIFLTLGANLQVGPWGLGVMTDGRRYSLGQEIEVDGQRRYLNVELGRTRLMLARSIFDGQLSVGVGIRGDYLSLTGTQNAQGGGESVSLFDMSGAGLETGMLWAPDGLPLRIGASFRSAVDGVAVPDSRVTADGEGNTTVEGRYFPDKVVLPWEVELGVAWQFGARPLNGAWADPRVELRKYVARLEEPRNRRRGDTSARARQLDQAEHEQIRDAAKTVRKGLRERYLRMPRQKLLVSAALLLSGPVGNAVGEESFLTQIVDRSGQHVSWTPRLGLELEPLPSRLQLRGGAYVEPSRFSDDLWRVHGTVGFDLKLWEWSVFGALDEGSTWRFGGFGDKSRNYFSWGASVGLWH